MSAKRKRNINVSFRVDENENALIEKRMKELGFKDKSAYLRKRAIDVHLINIDLSKLDDLKREISRIGNNINQIARKYNSEGNITNIDIEQLQSYMKEIIEIGNREDDKVKSILIQQRIKV